jgi:hypothetical protein
LKRLADVSATVRALLKRGNSIERTTGIVNAKPKWTQTRTETERAYEMTTRLLIIGAFLVLCASAATAAADVSGSWSVTITTADGKISGKASLKLTGDKVAGQIGPSDDATIPVEGVLTAHKLTLKTKPQPGRTAAFDSCEPTVGEEKMIGTIQGGDVGKGTIEFVRIKP